MKLLAVMYSMAGLRCFLPGRIKRSGKAPKEGILQVKSNGVDCSAL